MNTKHLQREMVRSWREMLTELRIGPKRRRLSKTDVLKFSRRFGAAQYLGAQHLAHAIIKRAGRQP